MQTHLDRVFGTLRDALFEQVADGDRMNVTPLLRAFFDAGANSAIAAMKSTERVN